MTPNEQLIMIKAFLDLIKPSYSTYLMAGEVNFEDNAAARDIGFQGSEYQFVPKDHTNDFIHHDGWHYPNLDSGERTFDNDPNCLRLTKVYPEFILKDTAHPIVTFDDLSTRSLDEDNLLDSPGVECMELWQIPLEYILHDSTHPTSTLDSISASSLDMGDTMDISCIIDNLELTHL